MVFKKGDKRVKTVEQLVPKVGFTANNGNRLELIGYKIKNLEFIPEQEFMSVENVTTFLDPDGVTVQGIQRSYTKTVSIKLKPIIGKADDSDAV